MRVVTLNHEAVARIPTPARETWKAAGGNLYLRMYPDGRKSWYVRKMTDGVLLSRYLGDFPTMTPKDARIARDNKVATTDPTERRASFGKVLDQWYATKIEGAYRRPLQVRRYLDRIPAALRAKPIATVDRRDLTRWLLEYAQPDGSRGGPVAANRALVVLKRALRHAVVAGYVQASPLADVMPSDIGGKESPGERVLSDAEIRALWRADSPHAPLLRFLLLTGQRIGEAQKARRSDVQKVKKPGKAGAVVHRWHIPAEHSKNKRPHWCTLSPAALAIVDAQPKDRELIFGTATNTGVQAWLKRWCEREGIDPPFSPHDLRRTVATRMNEIGVPMHVVEKILNHSLQGVLKVYNRADHADARDDAMTTWANALAKIVGRKS